MGKRKPNVLFIMADQLRFDCIGFNGNGIIRTPNLDRLAGQGANLQSLFIQAPVCVPSRQTFFTGRYPRYHRNRVNYTSMDCDVTLIQKRFQNEGYITGFVGKLHYFPPTRDYAFSTGFDYGYLHDAGPTDEYSDYVKWLGEQQIIPEGGDYRECRKDTKNPYVTVIPEEFHETTWCGIKTRELLKKLAKEEEPFFLFSSYWKPHSPFEIPEPWATMYDDVEIELPPRVAQDYIDGLPMPVNILAWRDKEKHFDLDKKEMMWKYRAYYGAVSQIDNEVGLTLKMLEDCGLADNTIVVFCSDHGDMMYGHGLVDKNYFFDEAVHTPFIIKFPGIINPGRYDDLIESTDVLASIFELCEINVPYSNQGKSFASYITDGYVGSEYAPRKYVFAENIIPEIITDGARDFRYEKGKGVKGIKHPDAKMIRSKKWKYNYYIDSEELYDLQNDPGETTNLAYDNKYSEIIRDLRKELLDWMITADEPDQIAPAWFNVKDENGDWSIWDKWKG